MIPKVLYIFYALSLFRYTCLKSLKDRAISLEIPFLSYKYIFTYPMIVKRIQCIVHDTYFYIKRFVQEGNEEQKKM